MQGRIVWFCLDTGDGIISTDAGQELPFRLATDQLDLQGGDLVSFDAVENGRGLEARNIRLVAKCVDRLNQQNMPLVRKLFATLEFLQS